MLNHNVYDLLYIYYNFEYIEYEFDIRISTETNEYSNYSNVVQRLMYNMRYMYNMRNMVITLYIPKTNITLNHYMFSCLSNNMYECNT